jgi:hypothetical protein
VRRRPREPVPWEAARVLLVVVVLLVLAAWFLVSR